MSTDYYTIVRRAELSELRNIPKNEIVGFLNKYGENLLHTAIVSGSLPIVEAVLATGIDINKQTHKGSTPLHFAVDRDWLDACSLLIANGASVNLSDNWGNEPLWTAVLNAAGKYEIVELLLSHGANPLHTNTSGKTPLDVAKDRQVSKLVELLDANKWRINGVRDNFSAQINGKQ